MHFNTCSLLYRRHAQDVGSTVCCTLGVHGFCSHSSSWSSSCAGIIRRVAALLVVGVLLAVALFFVGLKFTFPEQY